MHSPERGHAESRDNEALLDRLSWCPPPPASVKGKLSPFANFAPGMRKHYARLSPTPTSASFAPDDCHPPIPGGLQHGTRPAFEPASSFVDAPPSFCGSNYSHSSFERHRGELCMEEKYRYDLSRAQLKATSSTSALLAGFAMIALVELPYDPKMPPTLLIILGVVTTLLVSVHLLALMISTCILPYMEASGCTQDSPHKELKFYIDLAWIFSTCIGLILFLVEIGVIFWVKFNVVNYEPAAYLTTAMLVPILLIFVLITCSIHRSRVHHSIHRINRKADELKLLINDYNGDMMRLV